VSRDAPCPARPGRTVLGIVGTHPAVFVRVANKGVTGYGTWKKVRKTKGWNVCRFEGWNVEEQEVKNPD